MKLTFERDTLLAALTRISGVVSRKQTIDILQNVLIETTDNGARLTATNLDMQATVTVAAEVETSGATTVSAERLRDICAKLPEGAQISFDATDPLRVAVKAGRSRFSVGALLAGDFPLLTAPGGGSTLELPAAELLRLLTVGASCMDDKQPLNCCLLERIENSVRTVSTDRARMALCDLPAPKSFKPKGQTKLAPEAIAVLTRGLADMPHDATASLTILPGKMFGATLGGMSVVGRVIDGDYAPYQRVIGFPTDHTLTIDTGDLIAMLGRACIASNYLFLDLTENHIEISARDQASGDSFEESGACEWDGGERRLSVNAANLMGILSHVRTENVVFKIGAPMTPIHVVETGEPDWTGVVMPMVGSK